MYIYVYIYICISVYMYIYICIHMISELKITQHLFYESRHVTQNLCGAGRWRFATAWLTETRDDVLLFGCSEDYRLGWV